MAISPMTALKIFFLLWLASIGEARWPYEDINNGLTFRINDLMSRMSLPEKIGQMTQIERKDASFEVLRDKHIGSVFSAGGSAPRFNATASEWVNMINHLQSGSRSTRLKIPMIYGSAAVHGHNNVYGATIFPHNIGLGATRDPKLVKAIGEATALEARATAVTFAFAPSVAVCRDPRWGRCYESYSEDHTIVQQMTEIITGLQGERPHKVPKNERYLTRLNKVAACAKHFVGDGATNNGIDANDSSISNKEMFNIHMPPYSDSIDKGVFSVMVSLSSWHGEKMHSNQHLITDFLKGTLNFTGFVISDWNGVETITDPPGANLTYSVEAAISAGIDMVMVTENYADFMDTLKTLVETNVIPISRIDDAVKRILRVKFLLGLFDRPNSSGKDVNQIGKKEHRELARKAVRKSLVLLKNGKPNESNLLPLSKKVDKILVAGSHANNLGYQCGGWTIQWQGASGSITNGTTILEGIRATVDRSTNVVYSENPDDRLLKGSSFTYAIVVVGELPYAEAEGDSPDLTLADPGPSTIKNVCGAFRCVVVIVSGRPVTIKPYIDTMDAVVAAWLPGSEGQGVADVLFGDYAFTGKLPHTWFKSVQQLPMNFGDAQYDPLFPLGHGLTVVPPPPESSAAAVPMNKHTKTVAVLLGLLVIFFIL